MIEFTIESLVRDRTGEEKKIVYTTHLSDKGKMHESMENLAMIYCLAGVQTRSQRVIKLTKITATIEKDISPKDLPDFAGL